MTKAEILDDLNYVKTLAEEGKNAPLLGGRIGLWWGFLLIVTLFIHYNALRGVGPVAIEMIGAVWIAFGVIGSIGSVILGRFVNKQPGASSMNNRVASALWIGNTIFLFTYGFATGLSAGFGRIGFEFMDTMVPVAFGLYGLTSFVLAQISNDKTHYFLSAIALATVPISVFLLNTPELYLCAIFGVIFIIVLPAIVQIRREPKTVV